MLLRRVAVWVVLSRVASTGRPTVSSHTAPLCQYEFLDCGDLLRLERFGPLLVSRSCPSAVGRRNPAAPWAESDLVYEGRSGTAGTWRGEVDGTDWSVRFGERLVLQLAVSPQGQVGLFPEQEDNWRWIQSTLAVFRDKGDGRNATVLNGFAYTGGSTLAALSPGATAVTHLDASRSFNLWAARNVNASYFDTDCPLVRYVTEDCLTFVTREVRRGNTYDMLIFDPPAFGRSGSKIWKLDNDLETLVDAFPLLISDTPCGICLSCHDVSWPPSRLASLLKEKMRGRGGRVTSGGLELKSKSSKASKCLKLGGFARWTP